MKKILTIAAVLVMIMALSLSAFALNYSVVSDGGEEYIEQADGTTVLSQSLSAAEIPEIEEMEEVLEDAVQQASPATQPENVRVIARELQVLDENGAPVTGEATVTVEVESEGVLVAILHFNGTTWENVAFTLSGDKATFTSTFSPFVFVYDTAAVAPAAPAEPAAPAAPAGPQRSPQTGYNTVLWIVLAAAMVSVAGYCFVSARKKVED